MAIQFSKPMREHLGCFYHYVQHFDNSFSLLQASPSSGDHLMLGLRNGTVELRYDLGSGHIVVESAQPLQLGQTVEITVQRSVTLCELLLCKNL